MASDPIICTCNEVPKSVFARTIKEKNLKTENEISREFSYIHRACGACMEDVLDIMNEVRGG